MSTSLRLCWIGLPFQWGTGYRDLLLALLLASWRTLSMEPCAMSLYPSSEPREELLDRRNG